MAFGCDRRHMLRQLVIEHLLLGAAATCFGLALAACFAKVLVAMIPAGLIGIEPIVFDVRVGVFSLCISLLTALSFGLAPTVVFSSSKAAEALSGGSHVVTPPSRSGRRALVAAQFGLAFVLLLAAVVFGETLVRLATQPLGFDPSNLAIATIKLTQYPNAVPPLGQKPIPLIKTPADIATARIESVRWMSLGWIHTDGVIDRLSALPGIISIAGASAAPFTGTIDHTIIRAYGHPPEEDQIVQRQVVTEGYFKTMRIPILRGRTFSPSDRVGPLLTVVSQELERRFFDGNALGKRLTQGPFIYEVIGVVSNVKQIGISEEDWATLYELNLAFGSINHLIIRTSGNTIAIMPIIRHMIHDYDSKMVVTSTSTMMDFLAGSIADQRLRALLSAVFGSTALVLAAIGLFGLSAQMTAERRREIAVRLALGACPREVYALVLQDAWIVIGLGVVGGLPVAYAASKVARSFLFGVSPTAPHVFLIAISILAAVATIATSIPAHRATRIDPMLALRE